MHYFTSRHFLYRQTASNKLWMKEWISLTDCAKYFSQLQNKNNFNSFTNGFHNTVNKNKYIKNDTSINDIKRGKPLHRQLTNILMGVMPEKGKWPSWSHYSSNKFLKLSYICILWKNHSFWLLWREENKSKWRNTLRSRLRTNNKPQNRYIK